MNKKLFLLLTCLILSGCGTQDYVHKQHISGLMAPEIHWTPEPLRICQLNLTIVDPHVIGEVNEQMQVALKRQFEKYINQDGRVHIANRKNCGGNMLDMNVTDMTDTLSHYEASKFSVEFQTQLIFSADFVFSNQYKKEAFSLIEQAELPKGTFDIRADGYMLTINSIRNRTNFADKMIEELIKVGAKQ